MAGQGRPEGVGRREITPPLSHKAYLPTILLTAVSVSVALARSSFRALRVGLVEELVHLLGVLLAHGVGVDLVLYGLLGGRELLGALIVTFGRLVNGVGGAPIRQARLAPITTRLSIVFSPLGKACKRNDLKAGESGFRLWLHVESSPVEIGQICGVRGRG